MPKLTKTIMSPLTTMPTKNLMMAPNKMPSKPLAPLKMMTSPTVMTVHEHRMPLSSVKKPNIITRYRIHRTTAKNHTTPQPSVESKRIQPKPGNTDP